MVCIGSVSASRLEASPFVSNKSGRKTSTIFYCKGSDFCDICLVSFGNCPFRLPFFLSAILAKFDFGWKRLVFRFDLGFDNPK